MPKNEIKGPSSTVMFGVDQSTGWFLSVVDPRLKQDEKASDQVNQVVAKIPRSGSYLDLHTGEQGPGLRVSEETMLVYLRRYGVSDDQILELIDAMQESDKCHVCEKVTSKSCPNCKAVFYCNYVCQVKDWALHQHFCKLLPLAPVPKDTNKRVRGLLFPENSPLPKVVHIPLEYTFSSGRFTDEPIFDRWIKPQLAQSLAMQENPFAAEEYAALKNSLQFVFQLNDGSKPNQAVAKLTNGKQKLDWRGPVLVCKRKGLYDERSHGVQFLDIEIEDFANIRDFFLAYKGL